MSAQSSGRRAAHLPPARKALLVVESEEDRSARLAGGLADRGDEVEAARRPRAVAAGVSTHAPAADQPLDRAVEPRIGASMTPRDQVASWLVDTIARAGADTSAGATAPPDPGLFDALDDGVALVDHEARAVWTNLAFGRLFGVAPAILRRQDLQTLLPLPGAALPGETPDPAAPWVTTIGRRGDGSALAVDVRVRLVAAQPQRLALVTVRDAGPRQLAEQTLRANSDLNEQLRRSQKIGALGRLAGGVAHDFNNLLQVIGGYAEALGVDRLDRESRRRVLDSIQNATDRASSLTRQLLAFGRRQVLVPEVLDLNDTVRSLEHMLTRVIGEDVTLVSTLSDDLQAVKVDAGQIEQVVLNLAINARDAMLDGGTLEIATANLQVDGHYAPPGLPVPVPLGPWVHLVVRDTGCGMDADTASQAFEPFFTTKDAARGSGLGLSMVYGIVKQSGGYTWIRVDARGRHHHPRAPAGGRRHGRAAAPIGRADLGGRGAGRRHRAAGRGRS